MERKIGFIGLGVMGGPTAKNLPKKGYKLTGFDIVKEKVESVVEAGVEAANSAKEVAEKADVIITMVQSSPHVREAILGKEGGIEGVKMLDAPVARGVPAAIAGTLAIFVGGERYMTNVKIYFQQWVLIFINW